MPFVDLLTLTATASADIKAGQTVGFDGKPSGPAKIFGVARTDANPGEDVGVMIHGVAEMTAAGALSPGDDVCPSADSTAAKVVDTAGGKIKIGTALTAAAAGEIVEVLLGR